MSHAQEKVYSLNAYEFEAPRMETSLDPAQTKLEMDKDKQLTIPEPLLRSILNQGGIGRAVNIYGKALVIEEVNPLMDGSVELVMRKENGKSFFNFYPKVRARLSPNAN
ncbi:hypothetical protein [Lentiprolixibacter aurantiacus]|uniref:Uncharacterized protein n=1 Tax=Lentiprolixibacter aurantiacus TaxID=2993939 RepID=A0AAE3MI56_9FLAO|nr:hypothetical protein [Lentiprolixibacter aurantiacus]MCX2718240.1 hypothetical protein [Lentiprolixibacter aurantiacus]